MQLRSYLRKVQSRFLNSDSHSRRRRATPPVVAEVLEIRRVLSASSVSGLAAITSLYQHYGPEELVADSEGVRVYRLVSQDYKTEVVVSLADGESFSISKSG